MLLDVAYKTTNGCVWDQLVINDTIKTMLHTEWMLYMVTVESRLTITQLIRTAYPDPEKKAQSVNVLFK